MTEFVHAVPPRGWWSRRYSRIGTVVRIEVAVAGIVMASAVLCVHVRMFLSSGIRKDAAPHLLPQVPICRHVHGSSTPSVRRTASQLVDNAKQNPNPVR